jgi:hypothetical protein
MAQSKTNNCIELLINAAEALSDEVLSEVTGLKLRTVRRLRADEEFIRKTNRHARRRFLADMPRVLRALADAASDGRNASAMKLFLDVCQNFEGPPTEDGDLDDLEVCELLRQAREAGILGPGSETGPSATRTAEAPEESGGDGSS